MHFTPETHCYSGPSLLDGTSLVLLVLWLGMGLVVWGRGGVRDARDVLLAASAGRPVEGDVLVSLVRPMLWTGALVLAMLLQGLGLSLAMTDAPFLEDAGGRWVLALGVGVGAGLGVRWAWTRRPVRPSRDVLRLGR